jgi:hypothetical protein
MSLGTAILRAESSGKKNAGHLRGLRITQSTLPGWKLQIDAVSLVFATDSTF